MTLAGSPAAPVTTIVAAPIASITAGAIDNNTPADKAFDKGVDAVFDGIDNVVYTVGDAFDHVGSQIDQWESSMTEQAVRWTAKGAND